MVRAAAAAARVSHEAARDTVTGETRVLDAQGLDPLLYLALPRALAMAVSVFCLTIWFTLVAFLSGYGFGILFGIGTLDPALFFQTVLRGLQEVADALQALQTDARELAARSDAANHARVVLDTAAQQQEQGGLSQAALLDAKIRQLQAESDRISAQAARLADTAALFHALGGRW